MDKKNPDWKKVAMADSCIWVRTEATFNGKLNWGEERVLHLWKVAGSSLPLLLCILSA